MIQYLIFTGSLVLLIKSGDLLVKGAVAIAEKLGIPALVIGLTVVAFGTSAPELVISLDAALTGSGELAVGNVIGSNIANVLLVLGIPALIAVTACNEAGMKRTITLLLVVTAFFMWRMMSGIIGRIDGLILLAFMAFFLFQQFRVSRQRQDANSDYREDLGHIPQRGWKVAIYLLSGILLLPLAAHFLVQSAIAIAEDWNVSREIIGLTIVAVGTSLPELATGLSAARHGNASVAVGNVIGSNFFNIAAIMGITAVVVDVPVGPHIIEFDMWILAVCTLFLIALPVAGIRIGKIMGSGLLFCYAIYLATTVTI